MWKGTAETLKAKPTSMKTSPNSTPSDRWPALSVVMMPAKLVVPAKP